MLLPNIQKDCPQGSSTSQAAMAAGRLRCSVGRSEDFQHRIPQKKVKGNYLVSKPSLGVTGMPGLHLVCYPLLLMILIIF